MRSMRLETVMAGSMDTAMRWLLGINTYTVHGGGGGDDGTGDDDVVLMAIDPSTAPSVMQRYYRSVSRFGHASNATLVTSLDFTKFNFSPFTNPYAIFWGTSLLEERLCLFSSMRMSLGVRVRV
jgi:hypothetical protein